MVGETVALPLVAWLPLHPPLARHDVEFVLVQVSVALAPARIATGLADRLTVGVPAGMTVTTALPAADPPLPVQLSA